MAYEVAIQSSPKRMWEGFVKDAHSCFPKCHYKGISHVQYHDGDGPKVGVVRMVHFGDASEFDHVKQRFTEIDEETMCAKTHVLELGLRGHVYRNFDCTYKVNERSVSFYIDYPNGPIDPKAHDEMVQEIKDVIKGVDSHLLANDDYAHLT